MFKMGKYTFEYPEDHSKKKPIHKEAMKGIRNEESDTLDLSNFMLIQAGANTKDLNGTRC